MARLFIGTSGFKFDDWKGTFYPDDLNPRQWLNHYGERFNCLEVNASYYTLINPATFYQMAKKVPQGFQFTVKAHRTMTHEISSENEDDFNFFLASLEPLIEDEKFGCALAQFPNSFRNTADNRQYLAEFRQKFAEAKVPLVVEFRNRDWLADPVFKYLREQGIGFCAVDEPQFKSMVPPVAVATSKIGYVRFHGRNYETWWKGGKERYDYLYSAEELESWVPKIETIAETTDDVYVFMNNCFQAKAAKNAAQMRDLLQERLGMEVPTGQG